MALAVLAANIPAALRARNAWVVWRLVERDGKPTKIPFDAVSGTAASSNDPTTWASWRIALARYSANDYFDGIGIMLAGGDVTCIDLDHCIDDGIIAEWAVQLVVKIDSYTEVSQSGDGLHIFVLGTPPAGRRRKGTVEMYGPDDNRYIAITGRRIVVHDTSSTALRKVDLAALHAELFPFETLPDRQTDDSRQFSPEMEDATILGKALNAENGGKLGPLVMGDFSAYASPSEARMAAISILSFWTQDADQLVRMCQAMGFDRPDDERKMRNHDIPRALDGLQNVYTAKGEVRPIHHEAVNVGSEDFPVVEPTTANDIEPDIERSTDFPFNALPESLRALAEDGGKASGCAPEAIATHGLSVLAAAIGTTATIEIGSWRQRPIVWTAIVARPGTAKSTALNLAKGPLETADAQAAQHHRDMAHDPHKTTALPRRTLADDSTAEKLALMLQTYPRGLLVAADELSGVISGMNQYKGGKGNDRQLYLKLWSGAALRVDRISRDAIFVPSPVCSVTGSIQPARVDLLSGDDGMAGRWLTAYLEDVGRTEPTDAPLDRQMKAWSKTVGALLARSGDIEYRLTDKAYAEYRAWRKSNIDRGNAEDNPEAADYLGKLESHMARLCLVLHVADDPAGNSTEIDHTTFRRACRLLDYFADGAVAHIRDRLADPTLAPWEQKFDDEVRKAHAWFKARPGATWADAQRAHLCGCRTPQAISTLKARYTAVYGAL